MLPGEKTMTRYSNRELWLALYSMLLISSLYFGVVLAWREVPAASELFGHTLGIVGFVLMLMTETLYSLRKRARTARWGRMATWLEIHIFMGLVGPFLVLLHTSWKFNGLAGVVTLLMVIVVVSGFIGRYIYTAVPRTADGAEVAAAALAQEINRVQGKIEAWLETQPVEIQNLADRLTLTESYGKAFIFQRVFHDAADRWRWWVLSQRMEPRMRQQVSRLRSLFAERQTLRGQLASLAMARRLLGVWHTVHIPIGMALFTAAFVHIGAAIYYATLLR